MTRGLFISGYVTATVVAVMVQLAAQAGRTRLPQVDDVLRFVQQRKLGRTAVFVAWFWLGFHFLAR